MTPPDQFHIEGLCVLRGDFLVIDQLDHHQNAGQIYCITGPNGAGKSTLLRAIAGRLHCASGQIICPVPKIYVGHADGLSNAISGRENLLGWARIYPDTGTAEPSDMDKTIDLATIDLALEKFAATAFADLPVRLLSRGQRRRLALARLCLAPANSLWLLDEPNAGLDQASSALLDEVIYTHLAGGGMVLAATHLPLVPTASPALLKLGGLDPRGDA